MCLLMCYNVIAIRTLKIKLLNLRGKIMKYCINCGSQLMDDDAFCFNCGCPTDCATHEEIQDYYSVSKPPIKTENSKQIPPVISTFNFSYGVFGILTIFFAALGFLEREEELMIAATVFSAFTLISSVAGYIITLVKKGTSDFVLNSIVRLLGGLLMFIMMIYIMMNA